MRVAIGSDHAGFEAKKRLVVLLKKMGHNVNDLGTDSPESVDYPDFGAAVGRMVAEGEADRGVIVCGTGIGIAMAANKIPGVRAAVVTDEFTAEMCRKHNDANVLSMGARVTQVEKMENLTRIFMATAFEGGRHQLRVRKINQIDGSEKKDGAEDPD